MNWVGGARSRVKQHSDKKAQRDYFERKRLANKVQRLRPSLSRLKTSVSQDLLFLKTAVHNAKSSTERESPARPPKLVQLESGKRPINSQDLELPMSPIGQPSTLELMDVSAFSSGAQDLSFYPPQSVKEQPKVSTQKIPHNALSLDSFQNTVMKGHKESTLNSLCMTESLFPSSKHSKQHQPPQPLPPPPAKKQKTYSIDDILNAPIHSVESMHAQNKQSKSSLDLDHRIDYGGEFVAPRKKEAVRKRKEVYASNGESILTAMHGVHEKPGVYSKSLYSFAPWGGKRKKDRRTEVVTDSDAMLEFHYAQSEVDDESNIRDKNISNENPPQRVPIVKTKHSRPPVDLYGAVVPKHSTELPTLDESPVTLLSRNNTQPRKHLHESTYSSVLTEDPLSKRHLRHKEKRPDKRITCSTYTLPEEDNYAENPHNTTLFNESIFGPIRDQQKKSSSKASIAALPEDSNNDKEMSSFEKMILTMEDGKKTRERKIEHLRLGASTFGPECGKKTQKQKASKYPKGKEVVKQHDAWKNFVNRKRSNDGLFEESVLERSHRKKERKAHTTELRDEVPPRALNEKLPNDPPVNLNTSSILSISKEKRGVSVLEELMCLEENIVLDDNHDIPLTPAEWTKECNFLTKEKPVLKQLNKPTFENNQAPLEAHSSKAYTEHQPIVNPEENPSSSFNHDSKQCSSITEEIHESSCTHMHSASNTEAMTSESAKRSPVTTIAVDQAKQTELKEENSDNPIKCCRSVKHQDNSFMEAKEKMDDDVIKHDENTETENVADISSSDYPVTTEPVASTNHDADTEMYSEDKNESLHDGKCQVDEPQADSAFLTVDSAVQTSSMDARTKDSADSNECLTEPETEVTASHNCGISSPNTNQTILILTKIDASTQVTPCLNQSQLQPVLITSRPSEITNSIKTPNHTVDATTQVTPQREQSQLQTISNDCSNRVKITNPLDLELKERIPNSTTDPNTHATESGLEQSQLQNVSSPSKIANPFNPKHNKKNQTQKTPNSTVDAGIQVALESSQVKAELDGALFKLRQELEAAQSTIIWQSMMLKLYQMK